MHFRRFAHTQKTLLRESILKLSLLKEKKERKSGQCPRYTFQSSPLTSPLKKEGEKKKKRQSQLSDHCPLEQPATINNNRQEPVGRNLISVEFVPKREQHNARERTRVVFTSPVNALPELSLQSLRRFRAWNMGPAPMNKHAFR